MKSYPRGVLPAPVINADFFRDPRFLPISIIVGSDPGVPPD